MVALRAVEFYDTSTEELSPDMTNVSIPAVATFNSILIMYDFSDIIISFSH